MGEPATITELLLVSRALWFVFPCSAKILSQCYMGKILVEHFLVLQQLSLGQ